MSIPSVHPNPTTSRRRREEAAQRPIASALPLDGEHVLSINESHERCAALGLSRIGAPDYTPLGRADFTITRERNRRLFAHAAPVMELLFDQIVKTQSMVVLTDAQGTILHSIGDEDFLEKAGKVALAPGVNWAECTKGTNGMGTALVDETAVLVHADEHFMHANHFLTCQAAPILDPRGNILGVLDVSGDRRGYHQHTMGLVKMSARMIENHWLNDDFSDALRLHIHPRMEFIGTLLEGILAIDRDGRLLGARRIALDLLGMSGAALRMHTVASLLGTPLGAIVDRGRALMGAPMRMALPNGQTLLQDTTLALPRGASTLIQGTSGSGKSTLFRALAGIWPFGKGHVRVPAGARVLFLPQKPYIPIGTLRDAVKYPDERSTAGDGEIADALAAARLGHLAGRLDEEAHWTNILSGGEQQRLAIARALIFKPDWLFLDEATASLDDATEEAVYGALKERLPGTTLVSIGHRPTLRKWHDRRLDLRRAPGEIGRLVEAAAPA